MIILAIILLLIMAWMIYGRSNKGDLAFMLPVICAGVLLWAVVFGIPHVDPLI